MTLTRGRWAVAVVVTAVVAGLGIVSVWFIVPFLALVTLWFVFGFGVVTKRKAAEPKETARPAD